MNQRIVATETASYDIRIENEVCTAVAPQLRPLENETVIDVNQQLVLPALREMHIHIDKTYFGDLEGMSSTNERNFNTY